MNPELADISDADLTERVIGLHVPLQYSELENLSPKDLGALSTALGERETLALAATVEITRRMKESGYA